ncbi:hypothetical protein ACFQZR_05850 [Paenibacillus sp. GCM10027629]|uniref:hypothetical protein n=1 Tax=Paenibacillus sp. GCM10027629 TaxID=3273414 RepID=UPI003636B9E3
MKKRLFVLTVIMLVIVGSIIGYISSKNGTINIVKILIENVERGNLKWGGLSNEQVNSIKEMFKFSDDNELNRPEIKIRKTYKNGNEEELIATFEIFQYSENNQIENIYIGHLSFKLVQKSIFKWEVVDVTTIEKMKKTL